MKKCPIRLDVVNQTVYVLQVGKEVFGPYASETSARKAAGRADIRADIRRVELLVNSAIVGTYKPATE